jgi:formylglycine-generating enzyme required for sulfatase activity
MLGLSMPVIGNNRYDIVRQQAVDPQITDETASLLYRLHQLKGNGVWMGQHDGVWVDENGQPDSYFSRLTGKLPAIASFDYMFITRRHDDPSWLRQQEKDIRQRIIAANEAGIAITMCWHYNDPGTGRSFYAKNLDSKQKKQAFRSILPDGENHEQYKSDLRTVAAFASSLRDKNNRLIPFIFRPFHEFDGDWFWWGAKYNTPEEFKTVWRFTVSYLRDSLDIHNMLYAFSPDIKFDSRDDYLRRYPGDDYVDVLGMDDYQDFKFNERRTEKAKKRILILSQLATEKQKPCALTETGYFVKRNNTEKNDLNRIRWMLNVFSEMNTHLAYIAFWGNGDKDYCVPQPGDTGEAEFKDFFKQPFVLMAGDQPKQTASRANETSELTDYPDLIPVPENPDEWEAFRKTLSQWRTDKRIQLQYNDSLYCKNDFAWAASAYNCYFLMMYDALFYDHATGCYTPEKFLESAEKDFGRLDIVVLWHAYPRIGLDERNQFDFYRDMPGGLKALREVTHFFHDQGIRVFLNYNPWDTGTRRDALPDGDCMASMIDSLSADGLFLDTWPHAASGFRETLDNIRKGIVLESELALPPDNIADHHLSWAQWFANNGNGPGILRNKWLEQRHIQHSISRWSADRTRELHTAWMNGSGILIWENLFGQMLRWNEHDKSILRSISPVQNRFSKLFSGGVWTPMIKTEHPGVYANCWQGGNVRLWTLANCLNATAEGRLLSIDAQPDENYYDLIRGIEITATPGQTGNITLESAIPSRGVGCFLAINRQEVDADLLGFLASQSAIYARPKAPDCSHATHLRPIVRTKAYRQAPPEMCAIPATEKVMRVVFRAREVGYYDSFDPSFAELMFPTLHHPHHFSHPVSLTPYALDKFPVTNKQFAEFLQASGYRPADSTHFLNHWENGHIPPGKENHPVVYVDLDDARAYARWAGKRLPSEAEWQYAAQGNTDNEYPWGNELLADRCNTAENGETTPVDAHPEDQSPFGCRDLCGNVWEMTESEYSDGRNRFCILKGGSCYRASGSDWYFDGGVKPVNFAAKQLLLYPGIDRCSTIGFRCAIDLAMP